ncbi:MAG: hypothetical protein CMI12_14695 [Oceanospirillum sp.]|nr:hypothetical protein [Oceanospirillum sp.]
MTIPSLNPLSITSRVLISPISILLLLVLVSVIALFSLQRINNDVSQVTTRIAPVTAQAQAVSQYLAGQRILVLNYQQNPQPLLLQQFADREKAFENNLAQLKPDLSNDQQQAVLAQIRQLNLSYSTLFSDRLVDLMNHQQNLRENLESASRGTDRALKKLVDRAVSVDQASLLIPANQLQAAFQQARIYLHHYLSNRHNDQLAEAEFYQGETQHYLSQLRSAAQETGSTPDNKLARRIEQLQASLHSLEQITHEAITLTEQRNQAQQQLDQTSEEIAQAALQLNQGIVQLLDDTTHTVQTLTQQTRMGLMGTSAIAGVLGLLLAFFISHNIRKVLLQLHQRLTDIASGDGDLTARLPEQGGRELSQIAQAFNAFIAQLQQMMRRLTGVTDHLASASNQLASHSEQSVANARLQQQSVHTIDQAIHQLVEQIDQIEHNARQANHASVEAEQDAISGQAQIEQTNQSLQHLSDQLEQCSEQVDSLNRQTARISDITDDIQGIADQTSLLALNAAIEAARAGEHGRGFAVVADEVRHLSGRTHQMTEQIVSIIGQVSQQMQHTCQQMTRLQQHSGQTQQQAEATRQVLQQILASAQQTRQQIQAIAEQSANQQQEVTALQQQSRALQQTLNEGAQATGESAQACLMLNQLSQELQQMARQFRTE